MTKKKKGEREPLEGLPFDEALARLIQANPQELEEEYQRTRREEEEAKRYVEERRESIRKGARRAPKKFRL